MSDWSYEFFKELYFEELKRRDNVFGSIRLHFTAISAGFLLIYFFVERFPEDPHILHQIMLVPLLVSFVMLVVASFRAVSAISGDSEGTQYAQDLFKYSTDLKEYDKQNNTEVAQVTFEDFMTNAYATATDSIMKNHDARLEHRHHCNVFIARGFSLLLVALVFFVLGSGFS